MGSFPPGLEVFCCIRRCTLLGSHKTAPAARLRVTVS
jgi:hypothetical protein